MPGSVYATVRDAVVHKKIAKATYEGHYREMCPHAIGRGPDGNEQALFYQFGGSSKSGLAPAGSRNNWRCIELAKLSNVSSEDGAWQTANNHSRSQTCVREVDVEVDF
jgi:hypothetical protein